MQARKLEDQPFHKEPSMAVHACDHSTGRQTRGPQELPDWIATLKERMQAK